MTREPAPGNLDHRAAFPHGMCTRTYRPHATSAVVDAIIALARECARDALAGTPSGGVTLVCDVDPKYFARLEALLGRPHMFDEQWQFRTAFDAAIAEQSAETTAPEASA